MTTSNDGILFVSFVADKKTASSHELHADPESADANSKKLITSAASCFS